MRRTNDENLRMCRTINSENHMKNLRIIMSNKFRKFYFLRMFNKNESCILAAGAINSAQVADNLKINFTKLRFFFKFYEIIYENLKFVTTKTNFDNEFADFETNSKISNLQIGFSPTS